MSVTFSDLFCGAGGSSLGAQTAGMRLELAINHWQTAIDIHQSHFPDAVHDVADISQADPRRYPVTDVLLASPECTSHSSARGVSRRKQDPTLWDAPDPSAERSRATMWDVPRFAEQNRYAAVVVENVVEAVKWVMWPAWWQAMELLGYQGRVLSHNSQDHGVAQSRDRIYVVWLRKGIRADLEFERFSWCDHCEKVRPVRQRWKNQRTVGRYRSQWIWGCTECHRPCEPDKEPASSIIDWTLPTPRIGDRSRPLAAKTRERIAAGLARYGHMDPPKYLLNTAHGGRISDLEYPHPTVCASDDRQSLIVGMRGTTQGQVEGSAYPTTDPLRAVSAGGMHHGLLMRNNTGGAEMVTPTTEPARTMTTTGHQSLLLPYYGQSQAVPVDVPIGTQTTRDTHALIDMERVVDDCGFRMLEPYEVAAAMAFPEHYIPRDLTKKDQVKAAGNAVTPPTMAWIAGRVRQALEAA